LIHANLRRKNGLGVRYFSLQTALQQEGLLTLNIYSAGLYRPICGIACTCVSVCAWLFAWPRHSSSVAC